jgi:hypothetical protein
MVSLRVQCVDLHVGPAIILACTLLFALLSLPRAAGATTAGYLEYASIYGTTYNGVTTDSGGHLPGSHELKARIDVGRYMVQYSYHSDLSHSKTDATTSTGAPGTSLAYPGGTVVVPTFNANDGESEFRLEYQLGKFPAYLGLADSNSFNNYGFPRLSALGFGIELQPNPRRSISPYGSYFFFPNQMGTYPLANPNNPSSGPARSSFAANEFEAGVSIALRKTGLSIVLAYYQTTNVRRTGTFNFVRDGPVIGLGYQLR